LNGLIAVNLFNKDIFHVQKQINLA
jgi:hypothetical protein